MLLILTGLTDLETGHAGVILLVGVVAIEAVAVRHASAVHVRHAALHAPSEEVTDIVLAFVGVITG